jgi:hypothetical protein
MARSSIKKPGSVGKFDEVMSKSSKKTVAKHTRDEFDDIHGNPNPADSISQANYKTSPQDAYEEVVNPAVAAAVAHLTFDARGREPIAEGNKANKEKKKNHEEKVGFEYIRKMGGFPGQSLKRTARSLAKANYKRDVNEMNDDEESHEALIAKKGIKSSKKTPFEGSHKRSHQKLSTHVHDLAMKALAKQKTVSRMAAETMKKAK